MKTESKKIAASLVTPDEAEAQSLDYDEPTEIECPYCESLLDPLGVIDPNGKVRWISHVACKCEGALNAKAEEEKRLAEEARKKEVAALYRIGIKRRFIDAVIDNEAVISYLNQFGEKTGVGLYISGPSRSGKTYMANAITKAFYSAGYLPHLTTSLTMLDDIKASFNDPNENGVDHFSHCDVLIIDDLGKENANSWVLTTLFQVINDRYEAMRPTIVTTQYEPQSLLKRMSRAGEHESAVAIIERLRETCNQVRLSARRNVRLM